MAGVVERCLHTFLTHPFSTDKVTQHLPHNLRQILREPLDALLRRFIHRLLVLVTTPVTPQRKAMDLVFIQLGGSQRITQQATIVPFSDSP